MQDNQQIREVVSKAYADAVTRPNGGCCSTSPKGVAAKLAGYSTDETAALPEEAVVNSFGCGNPLAFAEVNEGEVVLDLGSGAGIDILLAAKKVGPSGRAIGVDMTDEMINKARETIAASGMTNVEVRKGIIEDLPIESDSVDWVISNCVINLSPEKPRVFAEIARVLKPRGRVSVSDIVAEELPTSVLNNESFYCSCVAGAISESEYTACLEEAGLIDVDVRERISYDADQLFALVESDLPESTNSQACGCASRTEVKRLCEQFAGKVWSARIVARKP